MFERKWEVREYRPEDVNGVRNLFAKVFHQTRPPEHFIWKFHNNPAGCGVVMVAEHANRIVGQVAFMLTRLRLGSKLVLGAEGKDAMIHPDYRRQGMFSALANACVELAASKGVKVLYVFPNKNSYHGVVHNLGFQHTADIPWWTRVFNPAPLVSIPRPIMYLEALRMNLTPRGESAPHGIEIRMEPPSANELLSLIDARASDEPKEAYRIDRSKNWFKWRFDSGSQRRYVWFSAYRDGTLKAWAAFGVNDWGELPLIDMSGSDADALEAVVSRASHHAKQLGLPLLMSVTNDGNNTRALKSCGYLRYPQYRSMPLCVRQLPSRKMEADIYNHSLWCITSQDLNTF